MDWENEYLTIKKSAMHLLYSKIFYYVFYFKRFSKPLKYNQWIQNVINLNAMLF